MGFDFAHDFDAREVAHDEIGEDDVETIVLEQAESLGAGGGDGALVAGARQAFGGRFGVGPVVVDD